MKVLRLARIVVAIAMAWSVAVLAAVWLFDLGGSRMWRAVGPEAAAWTLGAFVLNHLLRFARWHWLLRAEGYTLRPARSLSIFLAGLALLPTPAKAGVAVRSLLLRSEGVPVHVSLAAYFVERLTDLLGLLMLAGLALAASLGGRGSLALAGATGLAGLALVHAAPAICRGAIARSASFPRAVAALEWLSRMFEDAAVMMSGWRLPLYVALGAMANAVTGMLLWVLLAPSPTPLDPAMATGILALSHLSGSVSMLPGGLGGFELAMAALLASQGVAAPLALGAIVWVRLATVWGSVALGLPLLGMRMRGGAEGATQAADRIPP